MKPRAPILDDAAVLPATLRVEGTLLRLEVTRKPVKNINARLRGDVLAVSAPPTIPPEELLPLLGSLAQRLLRRVHGRTVNRELDALDLAQRVARRFPEPTEVQKVMFVTTQQACWGSYSSRTRTVRLHATLRQMPRWVLEAVVAHELAHVTHLDHSPAFWALLREVCPATDRARAFLAGVSWLARNWDDIPALERTLLGAGEE